MNSKQEFKYFYGTESDSYTFYRIPKVLILDERFKRLSNDAKILYGLMLDRMSLSARNGWFDKEKRVYIYYSMEEVMEDLNCSKNKALKSFSELDTSTGIGLIERVKRGQGKPSLIYVKNFLLDGTTCSEVQKKEVKTSLKGNSRSTKSGSQESQKMNSNNNESNNTELSDAESNHILSDEKKEDESSNELSIGNDEIDFDEYAKLIRENLEIDNMIIDNPLEEDLLEEIFLLIFETVICQNETMIIGQNRYPMSLVKAKFMKLKREHIRYVIQSLRNNTTKVRNIKKYMLATLFNAPSTISSFYIAKVNHDNLKYASG